MKIFSDISPARSPRTRDSMVVAYIYAAILVLMSLTQLFTYDKFLVLLNSFAIPGGEFSARVIGALLVISEVLALPFLLRITTSSMVRIVSMGLSWLPPIIWFLISLWLIATTDRVANVGLFGTLITVVPGAWTIFFSLALGVVSLWTTYGLWPIDVSWGKDSKIRRA